MQNKPNFKDAQMNVNSCETKEYENFIPLAGRKNKPNSNPNKANFRKAKMNLKSLAGKSGHTLKGDYEGFLWYLYRQDSTISTGLQVYISSAMTNKTAFFARKG
jgi:hypothetical protein